MPQQELPSVSLVSPVCPRSIEGANVLGRPPRLPCEALPGRT